MKDIFPKTLDEITQGIQTGYIDSSINSNLAFRPELIFNDYKKGKKVLSSIEEELRRCSEFCISVAFITLSGITPLLQTLSEIEKQGIPGKVLTTDYLVFSEPAAIEKLASLKNIEVKMFCSNQDIGGFHTKGYIFRKEEVYRIIIGSSNLTSNAITVNKEWNTKIVSTQRGAVVQEVLGEFNNLWIDEHTHAYEQFIEEYRIRYRIAKEQKKIARSQEIPTLEAYKLKPNKMQAAFIQNLEVLRNQGANKALLISATGERVIIVTGRKSPVKSRTWAA